MLKTISRHLLIGVAFGLFARIFGFIYYGVVFNEIMENHMSIYRPMDAWQWEGLIFQGFVEGIVLSVIYSWIKSHLKDPKKMSPFAFAIIYAIITRVFAENYIYLAFADYPMLLAVAGKLAGLSTGLAIGVVLYVLDKCAKPKKTANMNVKKPNKNFNKKKRY